MAKTLYIIDGHSQIFRAYYAPFRDLTSPTGEPTRATYVFCSMLLRFLADHLTAGDYLAMVIDGPSEKLKRKQLFSDYKITRKPAPEDFPPQARRIIEIVAAMDIPVLEAEGYEADDIMATAVERLADDDLRVVLVSRDKDLEQLVGRHVVLYDPMKDETLDSAAIASAKGYLPDKAIEIQTLTGDTTDNIPGVPGVGLKTAVKLIAKYGTADEVLAHADEQTPKLRANLQAAGDTIALGRQLVTLDRNVPIELDLEAMQFRGARYILSEAVRVIFAELGFNRLLDQLDGMGVEKKAGPKKPQKQTRAPTTREKVSVSFPTGHRTTANDFKYICVDTPKAFESLAAQVAKAKRLAVDTETTSVHPMQAELVGISLASQPGEAVYIPIRGPLGAKTLDLELVRKKLGPLLSNPKTEKIGQNLKYDLIVLGNAGFTLAGEMFDTMIAAHVLDSSRPTYKLDALAAEFLNHRCIPIEEVIGRGRNQITMDAAPVETVAIYAAEDADITGRLADVLRAKLAEEGLSDLMSSLEMPLLPVLTRMEQYGIQVDPRALKRMEGALSKQADVLRDRIVAAAGVGFNPDSPKQLAEVLFDHMGLEVIKKGKTGPSTDSSVLEQLAIEHELPALVLEYRKLTKLLTTYLKSLGKCILPTTGRVHTSFHQAGTATGRLSSSGPNLQNIPVRTAEGRQIRSAFVAPRGCVLLSADYSQVELRMLAHLSKDETLVGTFARDRDIHRIVAAEVFGVSADEVTPSQRDRAKTVNFGIIYGQTAHGLSRTLRISRTEAGEFIKRYRKRFPKIDEFLTTCVKQARENGYVETIFGRRRRIAEIDARNPQRRAQAERLAINSVVQGSAADLIKQAMINIAGRIGREKRPAKMLLQIHDELVFEVPTKAVMAEREMIVEEMTGAVALSVPLKVDVGVGANWMDVK